MFNIEYLCGGKSFAIYECEYAKDCNDKIGFTTIADVVAGRYGYCERIGEKCIRDDGGVIMSKAVREMTKEELIQENKRLMEAMALNRPNVESLIPPYVIEIKKLKEENESLVSNNKDLAAEKAEIEKQYHALANKCDMDECTIKEMQAHIDCLQDELAEIQKNNQEFAIKLDPLEVPIQKAFVLIHDTQDKYQEAYGMSDGFNMAITDLKQLTEHLLVYCNHAEVEK